MIDWIQGYKFKTVADFVFTPSVRHRDDYEKSVNTFDISKLKEHNVVYTHLFYVKQLFMVLDRIKGKTFTVISHNGDNNMDEAYIIPNNVICWWTMNVDMFNNKMQSIPIGVENDRWFTALCKKEKMEAKLSTPKQLRNLVYMNHNVKTNPEKRTFLYSQFKRTDWVTSVAGCNGKGFDEYLDNVYNHMFVICPEGNGIDTHRTWEALYMNTIPIEVRNYNNQYYQDLPICFVNNWEELTEDFLKAEYIRIKSSDWNLQKLSFNYWKEQIHGNIS